MGTDLTQYATHNTQLFTHIRGGPHFGLIAPKTVTFVLRTPYKPFVSLVGDFNDWYTRANLMTTDGNGTWWTTIPHPGETRYGFYVAIDHQAHVWVSDPCGLQILWDDDGSWAYLPPESSMEFVWHDQDWQTPALRDLVIYELCVRDFAGRWENNQPIYGDFAELTDYVDYLVKTGVNAVELMPVQEFPGDSSWGYNPVFYFAVESTYGSPNDFKRFVDHCHTRGIAVILDVAFNHAWGDHPYYQLYPPLYDSSGRWKDDGWNPFFHHTPQTINMWGGVDWDHFHPETTRYFQDVVRYWLHEYHVDGFRFDWVGGVDYDSRNPMYAGFDPFHGISAICWAARQTKPDCLLIGEYWQLEGTHPEKSAAKLVNESEMDACWNGLFHHELDDVLNQRWAWEQRDIRQIIGGYGEQGFVTASQAINYSCSHDEVRTEHEIKFYTYPHIERPASMTVQELALRKGRLGLITLFAAPGVPMIYAGQEFGEDTPRTIDFLPLNWQKLQKAPHAEHYALTQRLTKSRLRYPQLRSDHIQFFDDDFSTNQIVRFARWSDNEFDQLSERVALVVLNFGRVARDVELPVPAPGLWYNMVDDVILNMNDQFVTLHLDAWNGIILVPVTNRDAT